jgi:hypothetical protein
VDYDLGYVMERSGVLFDEIIGFLIWIIHRGFSYRNPSNISCQNLVHVTCDCQTAQSSKWMSPN